jgi:hypothetical protein
MTSPPTNVYTVEAFKPGPILSYLDLPQNYTPSPEVEPLEFLSSNLRLLPPHLLANFSLVTTPKQRTNLLQIRNRRLRYTQSNPSALAYANARSTWPTLWRGTPDRRGARQAQDGAEEKSWVESDFYGTQKPHVRKLGELLAGYEEERSWERSRIERRRRDEEEFVPEEDEDTDDEEEDEPVTEPEESFEESKEAFERLIRERFIYGLLDSANYDAVDWDESLDVDDDRDAEERWFDDEDED